MKFAASGNRPGQTLAGGQFMLLCQEQILIAKKVILVHGGRPVPELPSPQIIPPETCCKEIGTFEVVKIDPPEEGLARAPMQHMTGAAWPFPGSPPGA